MNLCCTILWPLFKYFTIMYPPLWPWHWLCYFSVSGVPVGPLMGAVWPHLSLRMKSSNHEVCYKRPHFIPQLRGCLFPCLGCCVSIRPYKSVSISSELRKGWRRQLATFSYCRLPVLNRRAGFLLLVWVGISSGTFVIFFSDTVLDENVYGD